MGLFHRHNWEVVSRRFSPPVATSVEIRRGGYEFGRELVYGITVVERRCVDCGDLQFDMVPGDQR